MNAKPVKIAVEDEGGKYRNLSKIVPYSEGGFAILVPYHSANEGFLYKLRIPENMTGTFAVPAPVESDRYSASDRVKLSFHLDGFVQFSGENPSKILSGRDADGKPKGLGILRPPLTQPIVSGPTFAIVAWGLEAFEECSDSEREVIRFSRRSLYYRGCTPATAPDAICIEGVMFPSAFWEAVQGAPPFDLHLQMAFRRLVLGLATIQVKVVQLETPEVFVGLVANHAEVSFSPPSGFQLCGPGDSEHYRIFASYPSFDNFTFKQSLDFQKVST